MANHLPKEPCDVCGNLQRYGPHRYDLYKNFTYDIMICAMCRDGNKDGWHRDQEERVLARLLEKGQAVPERLSNGLLPRGQMAGQN